MLRILAACALVVAAGILLAIFRPSPVLSDVDLTAAVNQAFLPRTEDPYLHDLAHKRAAEIAQDFSHDGMVTAEVLAWNQGFADPVGEAVSQWLGSPDHAAILNDRSLVTIGCGSVTTDDGRYFAACVFGQAEPTVTVPAPPAGTEPAPLLPNTAVPHGVSD